MPNGDFRKLQGSAKNVASSDGETYWYIDSKNELWTTDTYNYPYANASTSASIPASEREALVGIYSSAGGLNWNNNSGWLGDTGSECSWYGVVCSGGQVVGLDLSNNQLSGTISSKLVELTNLAELILSNNKLNGSIPAWLLDLNISTFEYDNAFLSQSAEFSAIRDYENGFRFSFQNIDGNIPGTITGIVRGLVDNENGQAASSITLTSWPDELLGAAPNIEATTWSSQIINNFDVVGGEIVNASFAAQDTSANFSTFVLSAGLRTPCCDLLNNGLSFDNNNTITGNSSGLSAVSFARLLPPFKFSFENIEGNISGTVTGEIYGLVDDENGQLPSSIILTSWPEGLEGTAPLNPDLREWAYNGGVFNVANGDIQWVTFVAQDDPIHLNVFTLHAGFGSPECCGHLSSALTFDGSTTVTGNNSNVPGILFEKTLPPFKFSFENLEGNVPGTVTGEIHGLVDNKNGQLPSSIILTSWPEGLEGSVPVKRDLREWSYSGGVFNVADGGIQWVSFIAQDDPIHLNVFSLYAGFGAPDCCGPLSNALTFDGSTTVTGNNSNVPGISFATLLPPVKFNFENLQGNVAGSVHGLITGLVDDQDEQSATSVLLTSWPQGLEGNIPDSLDVTQWSIGQTNDFDVSSGEISNLRFSGQEPGHAFYMNLGIQSNCCGVLNNLLSFNSGQSSIGNLQGLAGISTGTLLSAWTPKPPPKVVSQKEALIALYLATNGSEWKNKDSWLIGDECTWFGIACDSEGAVVSIFLSGNNLNGTLPSELGSLTRLTDLYITDSPGLTGSIPTSFENLENLERLTLRANQLSGIIPSLGVSRPYAVDEVTTGVQYPHVSEIDLSGNQLSGAIPTVLKELIFLRNLNLSDNKLSGEIPDALGILQYLSKLDLSSNLLSGEIPQALGELSSLQELYLSFNGLSGPIPAQLANLSRLISLLIINNDLSGEIPKEFGQLSNLQSLNLRGNKLEGALPSELADIRNLSIVDLGGNKFSEGLPSRFAELNSLTRFYINDNQFDGPVPSWLSLLIKNPSVDVLITNAFRAPTADSRLASLSAPSLLRDNSTGNSIQWDSVIGATSYEIYRCATAVASSCGNPVISSIEPSFTDPVMSTTSYYRVKACNIAGCGTLSSAFGFQGTPFIADSEKANFSNGILNLPIVAVDEGSGLFYYKMAFMLSSNLYYTDFIQISAAEIPISESSDIPTFTSSNNILVIPEVEVGTLKYRVEMQLLPTSGSSQLFRLISATLITETTYRWYDSQLLEDDDEGSNLHPQIGMFGGGNAIAVWERRTSGATFVQASIYSITSGWSEPEQIGRCGTCDSSGLSSGPQLTVGKNGTAIVIWGRANNGVESIYANTLYGSWGSEVEIDGDASNANVLPQVATDGAGNGIAVWERRTSGATYIQAASVSGSGWSAPLQIGRCGSCDSAGMTDGPQIDMNGSGKASVVWSRTNIISQGTENNIYSNNFDGTAWLGEVLVETDDSGTNLYPDIVVDGAGVPTAIWESRTLGATYVNASRFDFEEIAWAAQQQIGRCGTCDSLGLSSAPKISKNTQNKLAVIWGRLDSEYESIYANTYDNGWGSEQRINLETSSSNTKPSIGVDSVGNVIAVWEVRTAGATYVRTSSNSNSSAWSTPIQVGRCGTCDMEGLISSPEVAVEENGRAFVVWSRDENGVIPSIYGAHYSP